MGQLELLRARRFGPFFWTQFLGALNDNLFKNALVILFAFRMGGVVFSENTLVNLSTGLLTLPFFLFSAGGGRLAREPRGAACARAGGGPAPGLEPAARDPAHRRLRAREPDRLPLHPRHLVVLVLRRALPGAVPRTDAPRAGRGRVGRNAPPGRLLGRRGARLHALRAPLQPDGRARARALRLDRPLALRRRPVLRDARPGARRDAARRARLTRPPAPLAGALPPLSDRRLRRLLHR